MITIRFLALASFLSACGPPSVPIEHDPVGLICEGETAACLSEADLGLQVALASGGCFECVRTSSDRLPFAWTTVAPCAVAVGDVGTGGGAP